MRSLWGRVLLTCAVAALVAGAGAGPARALTDCFDPKGDCRYKPPCEYDSEMSMWAQLRALYGNKKLRRQALDEAVAQVKKETGRDPGRDSDAVQKRAGDILSQKVHDLAKDGKTIKLPECPGAHTPPPSMETTDDCYVHAEDAAGRQVGDADVERSDACREFVDAARAHEELHRAKCCADHCSGGCKLAECEEGTKARKCRDNPALPLCAGYRPPPAGAERKSLDGFASEEMAGYSAAMKKLGQIVKSKIPRCSPKKKPSPNTSSVKKKVTDLRTASRGAR